MNKNHIITNLKLLYDDFKIDNILLLNDMDWIVNGKFDDQSSVIQYAFTDFSGLQNQFESEIFCFRRNQNYEIGINLFLDNKVIPLHYFVEIVNYFRINGIPYLCLDTYNDYDLFENVEIKNQAKRHIEIISSWFIQHPYYRLQIVTNQLGYKVDPCFLAYLQNSNN